MSSRVTCAFRVFVQNGLSEERGGTKGRWGRNAAMPRCAPPPTTRLGAGVAAGAQHANLGLVVGGEGRRRRRGPRGLRRRSLISAETCSARLGLGQPAQARGRTGQLPQCVCPDAIAKGASYRGHGRPARAGAGPQALAGEGRRVLRRDRGRHSSERTLLGRGDRGAALARSGGRFCRLDRFFAQRAAFKEMQRSTPTLGLPSLCECRVRGKGAGGAAPSARAFTPPLLGEGVVRGSRSRACAASLPPPPLLAAGFASSASAAGRAAAGRRIPTAGGRYGQDTKVPADGAERVRRPPVQGERRRVCRGAAHVHHGLLLSPCVVSPRRGTLASPAEAQRIAVLLPRRSTWAT